MIYLFIIICNIFFLTFFKKISEFINVFDLPDNKRKIHKEKIPLLGGLIFLFNIICYLLYEFLTNKEKIFTIFYFQETLSIFIFFFSIILIFLIGYIDDKIKLSARARLIFLSFIILINLLVNSELNISLIKLSFLNSFSIENRYVHLFD